MNPGAKLNVVRSRPYTHISQEHWDEIFKKEKKNERKAEAVLDRASGGDYFGCRPERTNEN